MNVTCTHRGQKHRYGDSEYIYEIELEAGENPTTEEILTACRNNGRPEYNEWCERQKTGDDFDKMSAYFGGYYKLTKTENGYHYYALVPYCD